MVIFRRAIAGAAVTLFLTSAALADSAPNLGKQTAAVPQSMPLARFQRSAPFLRANGRPAMFLAGASVGPFGASQSWSLIKALGQFGTWTDLRTEAAPAQPGDFDQTGAPGFDLSTATYRSNYIVLVNALTANGLESTRVHVTSEENKLYRHYSFGGFTWEEVGGPYLIWIDRYLRPGVGVSPGDLEDTIGKVLSFATVQSALSRGYRPHYVGYVYDIDADANVLTALICHADGGKPKTVCGRSVIRSILKHVK